MLLPAGRMSVPNITAYMVSIGDVKTDESRAEIIFDVPKTPQPIVIYGMKGLRLPSLMYNSIYECPSFTVRLMAGNREAHRVRKGAFFLYVFLIRVQIHFFAFSSPSNAKQ